MTATSGALICAPFALRTRAAETSGSVTNVRRIHAEGQQGSASHVEKMPGFEGRFEQLGDYTVGFERFEDAVDAAPLFQGLPDYRCQSPH